MPAKAPAAAKTRKAASRFKMPRKPFWIRLGGVDVQIHPSNIKGKIPDEVIERAVEAAYLSRQKAR